MTPDSLASLLYLGLLGAVVLGYFLLQNRQRLGVLSQQAAIWALIFIGVIAAVGLWGDITRTVPDTRANIAADGRIVIPRAPDGHYYLTLGLNDTPVRFIVDTGASDMVLTVQDAERVGIDTAKLRFFGRAASANGTVRTAPVRLDSVALGQMLDRNITAQVSEGEMPGSLLGMEYLSRFSSVRIEGGQMILAR